MVTLVLELVSGGAVLVEWLLGAAAGWRYLFSPSYRQRTRARWRSKAWIYIAVDVVCGIVACAFSLFLLWALISVFAGWGWWTHLFSS